MLDTVKAPVVQGLVEQIEINAQRRGWNSPPGFYVIYDANDRESDEAYRTLLPPQAATGEWPLSRPPYIARMVFRSALLLPNPVHALYWLALILSEPRIPGHAAAKEMIAMLGQPGLVALALRHEGWGQAASTRQEMLARIPGRPFMDRPDSKEYRFVHCVDVTGAHCTASRVRGQTPRVGTPLEVMGAVPEALTVILAAATGAPLPPLTCEPRGWGEPD